MYERRFLPFASRSYASRSRFGVKASMRWLILTFIIIPGLFLISTKPLVAAQSPFLGAPVTLPGLIQAENYDLGGEGVAWHDTTVGNVFGVYRGDDMDVGAIPGGGYHIGFLANGEWAEYTVNVTYTQAYELRLRVASAFPGPNNFHIELNGVNITGTQSIAPTGDWHAYVIKSIPVNMSAGNNKVLRVVFDTGAWNFDSIEVRGNTPFSGTPVNLPGSRLQAENYDLGGEGVAWHDTTAGNVFGLYRTDDMDVGNVQDGSGGFHVGFLADGEWAEYLVNITAGGGYDLRLRYASAFTGTTRFRVLLDGVDLTGSLTITSTGGWHTYTIKSVPVNVTAGNGKVLRIAFDVGSWNLDWLELVSAPITMSILAHPPGSKNENYKIQVTGFSVSSIPNVVRVYGTAGYQQLKWNQAQTAMDNLYHGTTPYPDFGTLDGRQDCAHCKDPRLWDSRCSTDAIGFFWKRITCPTGQAACQDNDRWNASPGQFNLTPFPSPSVWPRTDDFGTAGYATIINHVSINNVQLQPAQTDCVTPSGDTIWVADVLPRNAVVAGTNETWNWVSTPTVSATSPFPGQYSHQSIIFSGAHQHYFYNAASTLSVNAGDVLVAYVYLDPANPPSEVMLQWNDGTWEHRAYWGADNIAWGINGTNSRRLMGPLPATGQWIRLEVPASQVGLEGRTLNGMAFTLFGGRATWDHAGKLTPGAVLGGCPPKTGRAASQSLHAYNPDEYATGAANSKVVQVKYADGTSRWFMAFNSMIKYMSVTYTDPVTGQKKNDSSFGRTAADNWRVMWATSPDGVTWSVHPQVLFRSPSERDFPWTGLLMTDMLIDNGYFYILFQDLVRPHVYLARARIDPTNSTTTSGYVQNSFEGWSVAANPIVGGQYTWVRLPLGQQVDFEAMGAYHVMAAFNAPGGGFVKQASITRIFKSSAPFSESQIFGVTNDGGAVQLWSALDITRPLTYVSDVILDPSIVIGGNGWEFGFTHFSDNVPATPRIVGAGFEVWVAEQAPGAHVLLTRRSARLSNF